MGATMQVFSRAEMDAVAAVVVKWPKIIVVSDEVYKFTVHSSPEPHVKLAPCGASPCCAEVVFRLSLKVFAKVTFTSIVSVLGIEVLFFVVVDRDSKIPRLQRARFLSSKDSTSSFQRGKRKGGKE